MNGRVVIRVDLAIERPWAVGGVADTVSEVDLPVLTDPRDPGSTFLPATSLVGSLRRHLGGAHEQWLGSADRSEDDPAVPSPLRCLGAVLVSHDPITTRATTAIDPSRRAARPRMLRVEEVVPATGESPTLVRWFLQLDQSHEGLGSLLDQLWTWAPVVGRRRSSGQGDAAVRDVHYAELDLDDPEHLTWWLGARHVWDGVTTSDRPPGWKRSDAPGGGGAGRVLHRVLDVAFTVEEPLHLGSGELRKKPGRGSVHVTQLRIPGSSWKGLFRHRVEHILRVRGYTGAEHERIVAGLFGSGRLAGSSEAGGERGTLRFRDTDLAGAKTVQRTHVAIDRVTGGAMDRSGNGEGPGGALFGVQAVAPGSAVRLEIDATAPLADFERVLLEHVVRDVHDRLIGVGGLTSRGYGTLRLAESRPLPGPIPRASAGGEV